MAEPASKEDTYSVYCYNVCFDTEISEILVQEQNERHRKTQLCACLQLQF